MAQWLIRFIIILICTVAVRGIAIFLESDACLDAGGRIADSGHCEMVQSNSYVSPLFRPGSYLAWFLLTAFVVVLWSVLFHFIEGKMNAHGRANNRLEGIAASDHKSSS